MGQAPKEDGVIAPVIEGVDPKPNLKILPTSPQIVVSYWSLLAQVVADIGAPGARPAGAPPAAVRLTSTCSLPLILSYKSETSLCGTGEPVPRHAHESAVDLPCDSTGECSRSGEADR